MGVGGHSGLPSHSLAGMGIPHKSGRVSGEEEDSGALLG